MRAIVARAHQSQFFPEESHENDGTLGPHRQGGQRAGNLDHRGRTAGIIIGAVINMISLAGSAHAQVIVMRGEQHIGIRAARGPNRAACPPRCVRRTGTGAGGGMPKSWRAGELGLSGPSAARLGIVPTSSAGVDSFGGARAEARWYSASRLSRRGTTMAGCDNAVVSGSCRITGMLVRKFANRNFEHQDLAHAPVPA